VASTGLLAICISTCGGAGRSSAAKNYPADICNRLQTCGDLSVVGASTLAECTASANQQLSAMTSTDCCSLHSGLDQCLATSDCPSFSTCLSTLVHSTLRHGRLQPAADLRRPVGGGGVDPRRMHRQRQSATERHDSTDAAAFTQGSTNAWQRQTAQLLDLPQYPGSVDLRDGRLQPASKLRRLSLLSSSGTLASCETDANRLLNAMSSSAQIAADQVIGQCAALSDCTAFLSCIGAFGRSGTGTSVQSTTTATASATSCKAAAPSRHWGRHDRRHMRSAWPVGH